MRVHFLVLVAVVSLVRRGYGLLAYPTGPDACLPLTGIGDGDDDYYSLSDLSNVSRTGFYSKFIEVAIDEFLFWETPQQARQPLMTTGGYFSLLSAYEPSGLDLFGRASVVESRRRCETYNHTDPVNGNSEIFKAHRTVAYWYLGYFGISNYFTGATGNTVEQISNTLIEFGLDLDICEGENYQISRCYDLSTPWGLAWTISEEFRLFAYYDGWNAFGDYDQTYNLIPYADWRPEERRYIPKNCPYELENQQLWQPLLESDTIGFLFHQEHVTPHIGYTGRSILYTDDEFCDRSERFKDGFELDYNYEYEMGLVLQRMANLTEKDKMEIEFFDLKGNLGIFLGQYANALGEKLGIYNIRDTYQFMSYDLVYLLCTYESILAAWKEKVDYDRVRPTTLIKNLMNRFPITTYAGVSAQGRSYGTRTFPAKEFEAYIRTMPHAEFPSGSACICTAFATAMIELFGDDVTQVMGPDGLKISFDAFSSQIEPLSTPSEDLTIYYKSWSEIGARCGQTRLVGGMHFTASVPKGEELCRDIGIRTVNTVQMLTKGRKPGWLKSRIDDFELRERTCYPNDSMERGKKSERTK